MKNILVILVMLCAGIFAQTQFKKDYNGSWLPVALQNNVSTGGKSDTAYSTTYIVPSAAKYLQVSLDVDTVSSSDSLWVITYGSNDNSHWHALSTTFTTKTAASQQIINIQNPPRYFRTRYFVMGASSKFHFACYAFVKD